MIVLFGPSSGAGMQLKNWFRGFKKLPSFCVNLCLSLLFTFCAIKSCEHVRACTIDKSVALRLVVVPSQAEVKWLR